MRSVRFEPELEEWLEDEARTSGRSVSEVIREAVRAMRRRKESDAPGSCLERVIGAIDTGGRIDSRNTGRAYTESLVQRRNARRDGRKR